MKRALGWISLTALVAFAVACGGGATAGPGAAGPVTPKNADAGADGRAVTTLPSGLPPMAEMPPPGVSGSKKAKARPSAALFECAAGLPRSGKDPSAVVAKLAKACAAASKMHAVGAPVRGEASDRGGARATKLRVDAGKCYRVYLATAEGARDAVALLRDSSGDEIASSATGALPEGGAVCFSAADEVTLMISVGTGEGAYAAQVWSD